MSDILSPKVAFKPSFPATEIEDCLRNELVEVVKEVAGLQGQPLPSTVPAIIAASFPIDSLDVVGILCKVDELAGFNVPHGVVRAGGYDSIDDALKHLMPRVAKEWTKRKGGAI
jgi:hypothetical protein